MANFLKMLSFTLYIIWTISIFTFKQYYYFCLGAIFIGLINVLWKQSGRSLPLGWPLVGSWVQGQGGAGLCGNTQNKVWLGKFGRQSFRFCLLSVSPGETLGLLVRRTTCTEGPGHVERVGGGVRGRIRKDPVGVQAEVMKTSAGVRTAETKRES